MINVIIHGCGGRMGRFVESVVNETEGCQVAAGVDPRGLEGVDYPVFTNINDCNVKGDVIIDFSNAVAVPAILEYCKKTATPVVLCTTGLSDEVLAQVQETSKSVAVLKSANMSVGVNLIMNLVKKPLPSFSTSVLTLKSLKSTTTRNLTHRVAQPLPLQTL